MDQNKPRPRPAAPSTHPAMAVGNGAPPVNSEIEKPELGRKLAVPSELVVRRLEVREDEIEGGGAVSDEVITSEVLLSSDVGEDGADEGCALEDRWDALDAADGSAAGKDEAGPAEESAAPLEGAATLEIGTAEMLGTGLLDAAG